MPELIQRIGVGKASSRAARRAMMRAGRWCESAIACMVAGRNRGPALAATRAPSAGRLCGEAGCRRIVDVPDIDDRRLPAFRQGREITFQHMGGRGIGAAGERDAARPARAGQAVRSAASPTSTVAPTIGSKRSRVRAATPGLSAAVALAEADCMRNGADLVFGLERSRRRRRGGDRRRLEHILGAAAGGHGYRSKQRCGQERQSLHALGLRVTQYSARAPD